VQQPMKSVFALPCSFCFVILRPSELPSFAEGSASPLAVAVACFFYPNHALPTLLLDRLLGALAETASIATVKTRRPAAIQRYTASVFF
jgi:hypothetical protein